ncbi:class I SAM-dependent methyltransferase [Sphingoaurantiacus capsulatus]|uniref:Class I SAM-dependent methyltransferase n=1 Tax=Sphingoaurantiacus capsulatus TaxID=1771310 RepID=A0ABV7XBF2_9SPHN
MRAALSTPRPDPTAAGLWSSFWKDVGTDNAPHERCYVPGDGRPVVDRHWAAFADGLPHAAEVIDLACGAGIVGSTLLRRRGDLRVTGIDWADVPTPPVANLTIHPWVSMEALPFEDDSFDAAVSLFGIEYGDIERIARELERVLKAGARFSFLVHHDQSEILREGGTRRRAIREVLSGKMRAAFLGGNAAGVDFQRQRLKAQFPGEPSMALLLDHLGRHVLRTRAERQAVWDRLIADFGPEISLLAHLERSAKSAPGMGAWLAALLSGMREVNISVLRRGSGEPIAWGVGGIR